MTSPLPPVPAIERLSPRVIRILGGNPSTFTLQGTNTYLVGTGSTRFLIDTAEGLPSWRRLLAHVLRSERVESLRAVLLTHGHPDHVGGVAQVRELLRGGVEVWRWVEGEEGGKGEGEEEVQRTLGDGEVLEVEGARLRTVWCPGHTRDHVGFVLEEEDAMFTGDNVLGHGTAVFEDLSEYMASLERMRGLFGGRAYPGHGLVVEDGPALIAEYIAHRRQREVETVEVLGRESPGGDEWWGSMELVRVIYAKYAEQYWAPAEGSVKQVLKKLEKDGKIRHRVRDGGDGKWALCEKSALL